MVFAAEYPAALCVHPQQCVYKEDLGIKSMIFTSPLSIIW